MDEAMASIIRKLPIGVQSFEKLRTENYLYVDKTEFIYQQILYIVFKLLGQFTYAEVRSAKGRADAVEETPRYIYVFEFKLNGTAEEAIRQIDERQVVKVGGAFDTASRNLDEWIIS